MKTAEETALADMTEEFGVLIQEDEIVFIENNTEELYSKSIEFIPNRTGLRTTIGYINFTSESWK